MIVTLKSLFDLATLCLNTLRQLPVNDKRTLTFVFIFAIDLWSEWVAASVNGHFGTVWFFGIFILWKGGEITHDFLAQIPQILPSRFVK